jgi:hypothetical protein
LLPILINLIIATIAFIVASRSQLFETQTGIIKYEVLKLEKSRDSLDSIKIRIQKRIDLKSLELKSVYDTLDIFKDSLEIFQDSLDSINSIIKLQQETINKITVNYDNLSVKNDSLNIIIKNFIPSKTKVEIKNEVAALIDDINHSMDQVNRVTKFYENYYNIELNQWNYSNLLTDIYRHYYETKAFQYRLEIAYALNEDFPNNDWRTTGYYYDLPFTSTSINGIINDLQKNVDKIPD